MQGDMDRVGRLFSAAAHRVAVERDSEEDRRHFLEWERGGYDPEAIRAMLRQRIRPESEVFRAVLP